MTPNNPPDKIPENTPLKILYVASAFSPSPAAEWLLQLAKYATEKNHIAYIASPQTPMVEELLRAGGVHIACSFQAAENPARAFFEGRKLANHIRKNGIDILCAHDARTYKAALWAGYFTKTPVVLTVTHPHPNPATRRIIRKADGIVVQNHFMAQLFGAKNSHICPPSYDPHHLNTKETDAQAVETLWSTWGIPAATTVILAIEPFTETSNYPLLVDALGRMRKLPFKAIFCADYENNPLFTELWHRIDTLGLGNQVLFIERPTQIAAFKNILAASDVVIFPDTTPTAESQSVLNAQAMGKAVIVCTPSGRAELVKSGETGWLVHLQSGATAPEKLALALTDAITDITRLQKMGITATRHCKEHYQNTHVYADLFAFYQTLRNPKSI